MFVVKRAFRNYNQMMTPGSIVEPGDIKWFKTRLKERRIVEVNEHNLDMWEEYFKGMYGVSIKSVEPEKAPVKDTVKPVKSTTETVKPKVVVAAVNK